MECENSRVVWSMVTGMSATVRGQRHKAQESGEARRDDDGLMPHDQMDDSIVKFQISG
jgi:hypothetical protein